MGLDAQVNQLTTIELLRPAARAANVNGTGVNIQDFFGTVRVTVPSGNTTAGDNNSTYTLLIQDSADDVTYTNVANVSNVQATNVGSTQSVDVSCRALKKYVRLQGNIAGGNSPSFPIGAVLSGVRQYR